MTRRPEPGSDTRPRFAVDIVALLRTPGVRRPFRSSAHLDDLGNSDVDVPGDVDVDVALEAIGADVVVSGRIVAPWRGRCRRCLDDVEGVVEVTVSEIFETDPTEGETYPRGAEEAVLDPMVREAVVLELPVAPLCSEECRGPDPSRYPAEPVDDEAPARDPRWSALDELRTETDG